MKTLRVCLSSSLPPLTDRDRNYLYFTYDDLALYSGQNTLYENFVIIHEIPEEQVEGMIYILDTDGSVHRKEDYQDLVIAEIEDSSQVEILQKAGTMFYVNSNYKYLDSQKRTITLPFSNGTYEFNVSAKNEQKYTNDTIIKYNEKLGKFEIYGEESQEYIDYSKPFTGVATNTVDTKIDGPRISSDIRISKRTGNILRARADGLYVKPNNVVSAEEFQEVVGSAEEMEKHAADSLNNIENTLNELRGLVSEEHVMTDIQTTLMTKYPDIEYALNNYERISDSLDAIQTEVMQYAASTIVDNKNQLESLIEENSSIEDLDDSASTYTHEIDYYEKAEEWYYPEIDANTTRVIIASALMAYISENENDNDKVAIIMSAIMSLLNE